MKRERVRAAAATGIEQGPMHVRRQCKKPVEIAPNQVGQAAGP
jgi:hypothetical protein